jgi:hypothetical protein
VYEDEEASMERWLDHQNLFNDRGFGARLRAVLSGRVEHRREMEDVVRAAVVVMGHFKSVRYLIDVHFRGLILNAVMFAQTLTRADLPVYLGNLHTAMLDFVQALNQLLGEAWIPAGQDGALEANRALLTSTLASLTSNVRFGMFRGIFPRVLQAVGELCVSAAAADIPVDQLLDAIDNVAPFSLLYKDLDARASIVTLYTIPADAKGLPGKVAPGAAGMVYKVTIKEPVAEAKSGGAAHRGGQCCAASRNAGSSR